MIALRSQTWLLWLLVLVLGTGCTRQARKARHLARANRYYQQHQLEKAELEYINVLRLDPEQKLANERLASLYYDRGQMRQAYGLLQKTKQLEPTNNEVRLKLARIYLAAGAPAQARSELLAVLEKDPANTSAVLLLPDAISKPEEIPQTEQTVRQVQQQAGDKAAIHAALANLAFRRQDFKTTEAEVNRALALDSKSSPAHLTLGLLRWQQNDLKKADAAFKTAVDLAPEDRATRLRWADFKFRTGDLAEARKLTAAIVQEAPDYLPANLLLARIDLTEKKYDEADALLKQVLERNPSQPDVELLHAQLNLARTNAPQAISDLERVRDQLPKFAPVYHQLGLAYLMNRDLDKATENLNRAINLQTNFTEAILLLAQINLQKGNFGPAIASLSNLVSRSTNEQALVLLGDAYRAQGRSAEALSYYKRWRDLSPKNPQAPYLIGLTLRQQKQDDEARKAFETASQLAPDFLPAVDQLVDLDLRDKNYPAALNRAQQLIQRNPKAAGPLLLLAKIHLAQRNPNEAEADLVKATELDPNADAAYLLLTQLYIWEKKAPQALQQLQALVAREPNNTSALLQIGLLRERAKEYAKSREAYEKVIQLNPRSAVAFNNLAYLCSEHLNDLDAAFRYAQKARDLATDDPAIADTLGSILCRRRDYSWALALLREAAAKRPDDPEIQWHLGTAHYQMADEEPARVALKRACEKEFPGKTEAQAKLWVLDLNPQTAGSDAIGRLKQAVDQDSNDVMAWLRLAAIAERDGDLKQALSSYQNAAKASPKSVPIMLTLGRFYAERLHDPAKAVDQAKAAHDQVPDDPQVTQILGRFTYLARDYTRAYNLFQDCLARRPNDPEVLFDVGLAAYALGRVPESVRVLRQALAADANFPHAGNAKQLLDLTAALDHPIQDSAAEAQAQQILKNNPESAPALMLTGALAEQRGQFQQASDAYERVLKVYPDFGPASRRLAFLYADQLSDDRKALEQGLKAREDFPDDPELAKLVGRTAYRLKDYSRAVQFLRESAQKRPQDAEVYYYLGMAQYALKQNSQSKDAFQKALSLNPNAGLAQDAKRILAELK